MLLLNSFLFIMMNIYNKSMVGTVAGTLLIAVSAFAQTASPTPTPTPSAFVSVTPSVTVSPTVSPTRKEERKMEQEERMVERKAQQVERMEKKIEKLEERRKENIRRHFRKMRHRFEVLVKRLYNFSNPISRRLDRMAGAGINVATPQAKLAAVREEIAKLKTDLNSASSTVDAILHDTANPKEAFEEVRGHVKSFMDRVKKIHRMLIDIIVSLKGMSEKPSVSPSVSPTASPNASPTPTPTLSPSVSP